MDMSQYRDLFLTETREHLRSFNELIVALEQESGDREKIDSLFREAHSIKGMAASMGYDPIADLAHRMEDLMDRVRKDELQFVSGIADLLLAGADLIEALVGDIAGDMPLSRDISGLVQRLIDYTPPVEEEPVPPAPEEKAVELLAPQTPDELQKPGKGVDGTQQTVRVKTGVLDNLINTTGELITNKHRLTAIGRELGSDRLDSALAELTRLLRELHNEVLNVRLMPFSLICDRLPRLIRELAQKSGKEIDFAIEGKDLEIDRRILEELSDPLVHMLRNAVDHGLESPEERRTAGKAVKGRILLSARRVKDQVVITVQDDGRGMDPAKLIESAVARGVIKPADAARLSVRETFMLTCIPGFSTARKITDVSGRGVGMDVVRAKVQSLGGTLAIDSEPGRGSRITLKLPLTIAIINVLLIAAANCTMAVPVSGIQRTAEIRRSMIISRDGRKVFQMDGEDIPLVSLNRIFGLPSNPSHGETLPLFVAEIRGRRVALIVDRLLGQHEVFVKPLGRPLTKLRGIAGGAILGDGEVAYILDVANLF